MYIRRAPRERASNSAFTSRQRPQERRRSGGPPPYSAGRPSRAVQRRRRRQRPPAGRSLGEWGRGSGGRAGSEGSHTGSWRGPGDPPPPPPPSSPHAKLDYIIVKEEIPHPRAAWVPPRLPAVRGSVHAPLAPSPLIICLPCVACHKIADAEKCRNRALSLIGRELSGRPGGESQNIIHSPSVFHSAS